MNHRFFKKFKLQKQTSAIAPV